LRDRRGALPLYQLLEKALSPGENDLLMSDERLQLVYELQTISDCYFLVVFLGLD
jgi:hypothetical protein